MQPNGVYTENDQAPLMFINIGDRHNGELLSCLQAFESSLLMIGMGRWTNALISIGLAVELLAKSSCERPTSFLEAIDEFCSKHHLSEELKQAAHETRKKRNDYIHHSTIPKDNEDAILTYMRKSLGVLTVFLDKEFLFDLYQSIFFPPLKQNLKVAKNIAKAHSGETPVGYSMSILVKTITNTIHPAITPQAMFYRPDEASGSWEAWDTIEELRKNFADCCDGDVVQPFDEIVSVECPANCEGYFSIAVANSEGDDLEREVFTHAKCCDCGLEIYSRPLISAYLLAPLGKEKIAEFLGSYGINSFK